MQEIFLKDKIMSNLNSQEKLYNYNLVDYGKKVPLALITKDSQVNCNEKVFQFTEDEAYKLNYAFALNRSDKRYVRAD
tara:strand:- start:307 stop:540 length:234 start_codon:yes stop_codon:yes gene_type:complete